MACDRCRADIPVGEEHEHSGQRLCEDCYMDALSPARTCDPWAVHSARTFENLMGAQGTLTDLQQRILAILRETGGVERDELLRRLGEGLSDADLTREFASLRHMEKARAEKRGDRVFLRTW
jgi:hypothetical protein